VQPYGVRDVETLLRLPRSTIRALIAAGFVSPTRGPRGAWRFSFQDLIVLRTAQALVEAKVPQRRITRSMAELRRRLPETMPLSGLSIGAVGSRVVVREGGGRWRADSGQYVLDFEGDPAEGSLSVIERPATAADPGGASEWFERGLALERTDVRAAIDAYEHAIIADLSFVDAYVNLGRLLHETRRYANAERIYRAAIKACGRDPVLLYNLGVLLDDMRRPVEAVVAYEAALAADAAFADCHYNLALLYEKLARPKEALRHMARYRILLRQRSK
jgi:hypothetical protein